MNWILVAVAAAVVAVVAAAIATLVARNQSLADELARQKEALGATRELLDRTDEKLRETFQSLARDALKDNRTAFFDLAKPIADTLKKVDLRLEEVERARVDAYARLTEKITTLSSTTDLLSRALRTPSVRGRWGEMQLRRVLEITGMLPHCDFEEQPTLYGDNGRLRPDAIVHLPGGKRIVVDVKTPLEAFLDAQEAVDDKVRTAKLELHARQVLDHMDKLGSKAYWEPLGDSPEMVVMFLPGEMLFSAALQRDHKLIERGFEHKVLLASPITLIALLTTAAQSWRQEALAENYREVAQLGKDFYERLAKFADHFNEIGKKLNGAVHAYNDAVGSFESRLLVSARRLKDLEVTAAPELLTPEPIDTVPRALKQAGLMGITDAAASTERDVT
jgi:DNA recombination protein RmuC